ncbi:EF-hand domain-containing protein [Rhodobacteraceae bacterium LMO-12]|nr:EF-hand domain-containing protein [Rhodobacteraceae bacterium LMO-JJ12]
MMIRAMLLGAMALVASQAVAATELVDTDGNGSYSMEEMAAAYPGLTEEQFAEIDADENGEIDEVELVEAIEGGVIEG